MERENKQLMPEGHEFSRHGSESLFTASVHPRSNRPGFSGSLNRGKLIVVEGGVGCGKTTMLSLLANECLPKGEWSFFREPGGTAFGDLVRNAVQGNHGYEVHPYAELFAYSAARANLIRGVIIPRIKMGNNIGLDRYWYSTYAYQGARGISKPLIMIMSHLATGGLKPNYILHYDLAPEVGIARKKATTYAEEVDRLDMEGLDFHHKVRINYQQLSDIYKFRGWRVIDASQTIDEVFQQTINVLRSGGIIN